MLEIVQMKNKVIFTTKDLKTGAFSILDKEAFYKLMTDPDVLQFADQQSLDVNKVQDRFNSNIDRSPIPSSSQDNIWGIYTKAQNKFCGIVALYTNEDDHWEIGYRFLPSFWAKGYGTQVTKGIIDYCFTDLAINYLRADVDVRNIASVKILDKFMSVIDEFHNEHDKSVDRRYELKNYS